MSFIIYFQLLRSFVSLFFIQPTAVIVSVYEDPVQPQQAASVVEKLGDYLITCGY